MTAADQYLTKAKRLAAQSAGLPAEEVYVVWFCKTLGNWKALVSTDAVSGLYIEVTYNGAKREAYVDTYTKTDNRAIADEVTVSMANSIDTRLAALEGRLGKAETTIKKQHGTIVALQVALKPKDK